MNERPKLGGKRGGLSVHLWVCLNAELPVGSRPDPVVHLIAGKRPSGRKLPIASGKADDQQSQIEVARFIRGRMKADAGCTT